jgi:hypothetical protein
MLETLALDRDFADQPIQLPKSPYWEAFKDFGLDSIVAAGLNGIGTTVADEFLGGSLRNIFLPFAGMVSEKSGFYPVHLIKSVHVYRTTPVSERKKLRHYLKKAVIAGNNNVLKDLVIKDPVYVALMFSGLGYLPEVHPGVLSMSSEIVSVFIVSAAEVARQEVLYANHKRQLRRAGFGFESYYESRFCVMAQQNPEEVVEGFMKEFNLGHLSTIRYYDRYFENSLPSYSGRTGKLRLRRRERRPEEKPVSTDGRNCPWATSVQIVYTRAREAKEELDQCRYFPVKKEKLYFPLDGIERFSLEEIEPQRVRDIVVNARDEGAQHSDVQFQRTIGTNHRLAICTDRVAFKRPFYVLELKSYSDPGLLKEAMRYIMVECPLTVLQTTHGKPDLYGRF